MTEAFSMNDPETTHEEGPKTRELSPSEVNQALRATRPEPSHLHGADLDDDEEWRRLQALFVDDPRRAVSEAHDRVKAMGQRLIDAVNRERDGIERSWSGKEDASTEEMRLCLQRYRSYYLDLQPAMQKLDAN